METFVEPTEKALEPIELNDAELAAVTGGISLSFGNFGGDQSKIVASLSATNSGARFRPGPSPLFT